MLSWHILWLVTMIAHGTIILKLLFMATKIWALHMGQKHTWKIYWLSLKKSIMTCQKVIKLYEIEFVHSIYYPPVLNTCANVITAAMVKKNWIQESRNVNKRERSVCLVNKAVPISGVDLRGWRIGGRGLVGRKERLRTWRSKKLEALRMKLCLKCFEVVWRRNFAESWIT